MSPEEKLAKDFGTKVRAMILQHRRIGETKIVEHEFVQVSNKSSVVTKEEQAIPEDVSDL